jgi:hypothetical protein
MSTILSALATVEARTAAGEATAVATVAYVVHSSTRRAATRHASWRHAVATLTRLVRLDADHGLVSHMEASELIAFITRMPPSSLAQLAGNAEYGITIVPATDERAMIRHATVLLHYLGTCSVDIARNIAHHALHGRFDGVGRNEAADAIAQYLHWHTGCKWTVSCDEFSLDAAPAAATTGALVAALPEPIRAFLLEQAEFSASLPGTSCGRGDLDGASAAQPYARKAGAEGVVEV